MALECYINDFTEQSSRETFISGVKPLNDLSYILDAMESAKASIIAKIEMIFFLLTGSAIEKGSKKHQDLLMLVRLRNELVHRKPESTGEWGVEEDKEFEPHKFVKFFSDRGVIELPSPSSPPTWSQYLNKPEVAKWAYNSVASTIKDIVSAIPMSNFGQIQSMITKEICEI